MRRLLLVLVLAAGCTPAPRPVAPRPPAPAWTAWPPQRDASGLPAVVSDIESHLWDGNPYRDRDRITWVHEGTHGINSQLRETYHMAGFYVLENRAVLLREPATTLATVAALVPPRLRGSVYDTYLMEAQASWNNQPSYIFDEWVAYTNGLEARCRLGIKDREETGRFAAEFIPYAICVPRAANSKDPQLKAFLRWQIERVLTLYREGGIESSTFDDMRNRTDASPFRTFTQGYFGPAWTKRVFGF